MVQINPTNKTWLRTSGPYIVNGNGEPVLLYGAGLGGWMNMENFITGYPGQEFQHRAAMLRVLGREKYDYFFDRFLTYFFTDEDAKYYASLGLNCLRLPFNYRHFEDDMNPRVLKEEGFKHLDRVVKLCAKQGIYTILDLHAVPGGQNPDWHSDNPTNYAAFWEHKDFQDRVIWLWEMLASHYKDNPWVAGYNPLNEPCDPEHVRLPAFYKRVEKAIRKIDSKHMLFLDGNTFAIDFTHFHNVLPNCVYAIHDYSTMGFPAGERYKGTPEQDAKLEAAFNRKCEFMRKHGVPIWNGEFGPVYEPEDGGQDAEEVNEERYKLLGKQLEIYQKNEVSWSIWLYKDIGVQAMVYASPNSKWITTLKPFLEKKRSLLVDAWGRHPSASVDALFQPIIDWIDTSCSEATKKYPDTWNTRRHLSRIIRELFLAESLSMEFARYFEGMGFEELDEMAKSFALNWGCTKRVRLNEMLKEFTHGKRGY